MNKAIHIELAPRDGERASPDGLAIRSNKAWRELASEALDARDSARAANVEFGMTYANHLCAFHIGDSEGMALMGSPIAGASDMMTHAMKASNKGEAAAIRGFVGAALRVHSEALSALWDARSATEMLHAANQKISELREDIADSPTSVDMAASGLRLIEARKERDAAQARANNAETALAKEKAERAVIVGKVNSLYGELMAIKGALAILAPYMKEESE